MRDDLLDRLEDRRVCSLAHNSCRNDWAIERAAARIRELETELALYKGYHDGVEKNGTHVIVPVELLTEIDQWHDFYVADAPEWEGSNTVKVYISIRELRTIRALIKAK